MDDIILLCLVFFLFVRIIGFLVAIDFFHDTKDSKFIIIILGWIFWIIATIFPILINFIKATHLNESFLVLNVMFAVMGTLFYMWGFLTYYLSLPFKMLILLLAFIITMPLVLSFLINYTVAVQFTAFILNFILITAYVIPPIVKKKFIKFMGKSIRWYLATIILFVSFFPLSGLAFFSGYSYGLYEAENVLLIIIYYAPIVISTILIIIMLVHLEYTMSSRKNFELKDKFSHELGNIMQVINSSADLLKVRANLNEDEKSDLKLIDVKCQEASKLIKEIRDI
ncbi:MAG: hypothetical protein ACFFEN_04135 [Candidatus Thorarchaeota archaeon]